jgi:hypothetical protein
MFTMKNTTVVPAQAGTHAEVAVTVTFACITSLRKRSIGSRLRGNDGF